MPHLLKYTKVYDEIYPSSTQVLIRCEPSFFWTSESTVVSGSSDMSAGPLGANFMQRANLTPLIDILEAMGYVGSTKSAQGYSEDPPLRILTHCFSNGTFVIELCVPNTELWVYRWRNRALDCSSYDHFQRACAEKTSRQRPSARFESWPGYFQGRTTCLRRLISEPNRLLLSLPPFNRLLLHCMAKRGFA